jgi:hypothetical protein
MSNKIQNRNDTKANWSTYNPILMLGEIGVITDYPNLFKIGDGVHNWNDLKLSGNLSSGGSICYSSDGSCWLVSVSTSGVVSATAYTF